MLTNEMLWANGMFAIVHIMVVIGCILLTWWALQKVRWDVFVRQPDSPQVHVLKFLISIALGYQVARFLLDYYQWTVMIPGVFSQGA